MYVQDEATKVLQAVFSKFITDNENSFWVFLCDILSPDFRGSNGRTSSSIF